MSDLDSTISVPPTADAPYKLYRRRFYIIFVFGFLSFNQCLVWLTFSPIARNAEIYYNVTETTIDLFLNWGDLIGLPTVPLGYLLLNRPHGLRFSMILFAVTCFLATLLRVIPLFIRSPSHPHFGSIAVPFVHAAQILNAVVTPLIQLPVSQLSCMWFGSNERARATTFAIIINNFGAAIGFLFSPWIADVPEHIPRLLYIHLGFATLACVLTLIYFPSHPPTPPSPAAERLVSPSPDENSPTSLRGLKKDLWRCLRSPSFMLLSIVGGMITGTFTTWTGLFDTILEPENYSEDQAGEKSKTVKKTIVSFYG